MVQQKMNENKKIKNIRFRKLFELAHLISSRTRNEHRSEKS